MTNIYLIENIVTGQKYVGKTIHPIEHRFYCHCHDSNNTYIDNAIKAYGPESFKLSLLHQCPDEEWQYWEHFYIVEQNSHWTKGGYNLSWGGDHNPMEDEEVKRRHQEVCQSEIHRERKRIAATGKRHSLESRKKMSVVQRRLYENNPDLRRRVKMSQPTRISVDMLDTDGNILRTFDTLSDVCRYFGKSNTNAGRLKEMVDVFNIDGSRAKFWGYSWSFHKE